MSTVSTNIVGLIILNVPDELGSSVIDFACIVADDAEYYEYIVEIYLVPLSRI